MISSTRDRLENSSRGADDSPQALKTGRRGSPGRRLKGGGLPLPCPRFLLFGGRVPWCRGVPSAREPQQPVPFFAETMPTVASRQHSGCVAVTLLFCSPPQRTGWKTYSPPGPNPAQWGPHERATHPSFCRPPAGHGFPAFVRVRTASLQASFLEGQIFNLLVSGPFWSLIGGAGLWAFGFPSSPERGP